MISNGHNRTEIYEDYDIHEINLFYTACLARRQEDLRSGAVAARVSQADQKGWREFTKSVDEAIKSLVLPKPDTKTLKNEKAMAGFFQQLAKVKGRNQRTQL